MEHENSEPLNTTGEYEEDSEEELFENDDDYDEEQRGQEYLISRMEHICKGCGSILLESERDELKSIKKFIGDEKFNRLIRHYSEIYGHKIVLDE